MWRSCILYVFYYWLPSSEHYMRGLWTCIVFSHPSICFPSVLYFLWQAETGGETLCYASAAFSDSSLFLLEVWLCPSHLCVQGTWKPLTEAFQLPSPPVHLGSSVGAAASGADRVSGEE